MVKKRTDSLHIPKATKHKSKASVRHKSTKTSDIRLERTLIENFISMQRALLNQSLKIESLTDKISQLLNVFEESAKSLAKKDFTIEKESKDTEEILKKLDTLGSQNKIIAKGLTLMYEPPRQIPTGPKSQTPQPQNTISKQTRDSSEMPGYKKSLPVKSEE